MERKVISMIILLWGSIPLFLSTGADARLITVGLAGTSEYSDIRAAVNSAENGDTILIQNGLYTGPENRGVTINKTLTIRGIGGPERCIIDCERRTRAFTVQIDNPNAQMVFEGLTIKNGLSNAEDPNGPVQKGNGGAILLEGSGAAKLTNCVIRNNQAIGGLPSHGGGICILGTWDVQIQDSMFKWNIAIGGDGEDMYYFGMTGGFALGGRSSAGTERI